MLAAMLSEHIEGIYNSVTDRGGWSELLIRLINDLKFRSGSLSLETFGGKGLVQRYDHGFSEEERRLIVSYYHKLDPWTQKLSKLPKGRFFSSHQLVSYTQLKSTEFYNDFCRKFDVRHASGMYIDTGSSLGFRIAFQSGHDTSSHRKKIGYLNHLAAHFSKAVELRNRIEQRSSDSFTGLALEKLGYPAMLVDQNGVVIAHNDKAESLFMDGTALRNINGRLQLPYCYANQANLDEMLHLCIRFAQGDHLSSPQSHLRLQSINGSHYYLRISPIRISDVMFGTETGRFLSLLTIEPETPNIPRRTVKQHPTDLDLCNIATQYRLTEKEVALVEGLAEGKSLREICEEQRRSIHTIRSHLKSVLSKTGTSSQAQLVAKVLR